MRSLMSIMQAYANGETVQRRKYSPNGIPLEYEDDEDPDFNYGDFRIKPNPSDAVCCYAKGFVYLVENGLINIIDTETGCIIKTIAIPLMLTKEENDKAIKDAQDMAKKILDGVV